MSRLDSFIRRLTAQKLLIERAVELVRDVPGPVLELGLGMARTFDHLREIRPGREIFVFDRAVSAHPASIPDGEHMIVGEIRETLAFCGPRVKAPAAFVHCDLGTGDPTADLAKAEWLAPLITERTASGGFVASGVAMELPDFEELPIPPGLEKSRYRLYRKR